MSLNNKCFCPVTLFLTGCASVWGARIGEKVLQSLNLLHKSFHGGPWQANRHMDLLPNLHTLCSPTKSPCSSTFCYIRHSTFVLGYEGRPPYAFVDSNTYFRGLSQNIFAFATAGRYPNGKWTAIEPHCRSNDYPDRHLNQDQWELRDSPRTLNIEDKLLHMYGNGGCRRSPRSLSRISALAAMNNTPSPLQPKASFLTVFSRSQPG